VTFFGFAVLILLISVLWYEHSLVRNEVLGYDAKIYTEAGRGNLDYVAHDQGQSFFWSYPSFSYYLWYWCRWCSFPTAFAIQYLFSIVSWLVISYNLYKYGVAGQVLSALTAYPMLLILESGNVAAILSGMALNPWLAIISLGIKPQYALFCVPHFALLLYSRKRLGLRSQQEELTAPGHRVCSPYEDSDIEAFSLYEVLKRDGWK